MDRVPFDAETIDEMAIWRWRYHFDTVLIMLVMISVDTKTNQNRNFLLSRIFSLTRLPWTTREQKSCIISYQRLTFIILSVHSFVICFKMFIVRRQLVMRTFSRLILRLNRTILTIASVSSVKRATLWQCRLRCWRHSITLEHWNSWRASVNLSSFDLAASAWLFKLFF